MRWVEAIEAKPRYQWEDDSAPSQSDNCGPTCVAHILGYYHDNVPGIEHVRRTVTTCCHPCTYQQQADMLTAGGVPATCVNIDSLAELDDLLDSQRRPVILALYMANIPYSIRGHVFTGWHAVVCRKKVTRNGVVGYLINDPNFSPPGGVRTDPTDGERFYPAWVLQQGFINYYQHWAIVPNRPKTVHVEMNDDAIGDRIRTRARLGHDEDVWAVMRDDGIYHVTLTGKDGRRLSAKGYDFKYRDKVTDAAGNRFWKVRGYGKTLYIRYGSAHSKGA